MFNKIFKFFIENNLTRKTSLVLNKVTLAQISLCPSLHEIYKCFDKGHEVRGVFLDILKAFTKFDTTV